MSVKDKACLGFTVLLILSVISITTAQNFWKIHSASEAPVDKRIKISWCTTSIEEQRKCKSFKMANERDRIRVGYDYFRIECKQAFNKDECMQLLDQEQVTLTSLDAGEMFIGGRYHSLVPISQQVHDGGFRFHYSVAVIKKGELNDVRSMRGLRGKKACFAGVGTMAGWILPIYRLMKEAGMDVIDCNNHVKSAISFFGPSCAVNSLKDQYNPIGDNSDKLCLLCTGKIPGGRCTDSDPYAGYEGAFRCLLEAGEIAFLKHTTVPILLSGSEFGGALTKDAFELLCPDGSRRPIDAYQACNWGVVPSDAIVTSSAATLEMRQKYVRFLAKAAELYGGGPTQQFNNTFNNQNNYNARPEYEQFGNRIGGNRFKRQNFGQNDPYNRDRSSTESFNNAFDPNRQNNPKERDPYNSQFDQSQNNYNQNDRDFYNRNRQFDPSRPQDNYDQFGNQQNQSNRDQNPYARDPFSRDPYNINREQFGVNIDPYGSDPSRDINRGPFVGFNRSDSGPDTTVDRNNYNGSRYEVFNLFESSPKYGIRANLMFDDSARGFANLSETEQTFSGFLGPALDIIMGVRDCPVKKMTLCVTSDPEMEKCVKMRTAQKAQLLMPEMVCYKAHSQINCMQAIQGGLADVAVLDASDVYTAGLNFDLVPFISEVYNLGEPEYYVVAVAKESDPSTELTYLRGKYTCHGGISTAAGWVYPLAFLISNGWIRPYGCNAIRAAAEYFTKSCIPGALSSEYNTGVPYDNMCDLCHGASYRYCRRDASEDYYGHTGAFRCLVEGGGHVAFVKHTTVDENTGGKRKEWWARDNLIDDFELLCPDGTRAEVQDYPKCNLGKVKANAIVTRGGYSYNETQINAYINLFMYSQTFYGRKTQDEFSFSMFSSTPPYTDLIFQDATQQLKVIPRSKRYYSDYLGTDFMRARRIVDCHAGAGEKRIVVFNLILLMVAVFYTR